MEVTKATEEDIPELRELPRFYLRRKLSFNWTNLRDPPARGKLLSFPSGAESYFMKKLTLGMVDLLFTISTALGGRVSLDLIGRLDDAKSIRKTARKQMLSPRRHRRRLREDRGDGEIE